ncbi:unnamed protein product [Pseudo-nitzschia multistriata]|uniref:Uncharacterized protein n=1 Tax=Pseudo-nitzschia multistriata TaxID=183589 RepID=A0A448Z3S7_9STRA|nr:unnamed protein product [Pseudo-nitzschia multistriata]
MIGFYNLLSILFLIALTVATDSEEGSLIAIESSRKGHPARGLKNSKNQPGDKCMEIEAEIERVIELYDALIAEEELGTNDVGVQASPMCFFSTFAVAYNCGAIGKCAISSCLSNLCGTINMCFVGPPSAVCAAAITKMMAKCKRG